MTLKRLNARLVPPDRYVLVTAGPVFTEEMWRLACCALQDAFSATLKPVKVSHSEERAGRLPPRRRSHSVRMK